MSTAVVTRAHSPALRNGQRSGPGLADVALALCWIPFASAGWLVRGDPTSTAWLVSATLLISFAHQPLTLALVYGDKRNFDLRRRTFTWSPVLFAAAVLATQHVSLTALAVVAGLWNAEHTLMQRYGIMRIHGRKAGQHDASTGQGVAVLVARAGVRLDRRRRPHPRPHRTDRPARQEPPWPRPPRRPAAHRSSTPAARRRRRSGVDGALAPGRGPTRRPRQLGQALLHGVDRSAVRDDSRQPSRRLSRIRRRTRHRVLHHRAPQRRSQVRERRRRWPRTGGIRTATPRANRVLRDLPRRSSSALSRCSTGTAAQPSYTVVILTLGGMHVFYDGFIWKRPAADSGGMLTAAHTDRRP